MDIDLEGFLLELENYEYGVKHIIPSVFTSIEDVNGAFTDELGNILHARTHLEGELRLHPENKELTRYTDKLEQLDNILHAKREVVLKIVPNFARARKSLRRTPPRSQWWWYLDELEELEELASIRAYNAAKAGGDEAIPFEQAVAEIEQERAEDKPGSAPRV